MLAEQIKELRKNNIEEASQIAKILLQFVLNKNKIEILQKQEDEIEEKKWQEYQLAIQKVIQGIPLQYITQNQEFYGLPFYVNEHVLIPQPDTEILVEEVLSIAKKENKQEILDLCTGSGAIGITLAYHLETAHITMSDISKEALNIAKRNSEQNHIFEKVTLVQSNLLQKIEGKFDIIVSNPPYIQTNVIPTLSKQVQNEPHLALDGGEDGLYFYRKIIKEAPSYLKQDGYLCLEIGYNQKEQVVKLAQEQFSKIETKKDLAGNNRVVLCQK